MLILSRNIGEAVMIDESIKVVVLSVNGHKVRLGFQAPLSIPIYREEIFYLLKVQNKNHHLQALKLMNR
jgi:carbon storage regulator